MAVRFQGGQAVPQISQSAKDLEETLIKIGALLSRAYGDAKKQGSTFDPVASRLEDMHQSIQNLRGTVFNALRGR
jgi:uncharacterized protein YoxC